MSFCAHGHSCKYIDSSEVYKWVSECKHEYFQSEYGGIWGGIGLARECWRAKTSVCYCVCVCMCVCGVKARDTVSIVHPGKVWRRQPPFSRSTSMFYLSGVAKQAVCLTQQQPQQQQKSQRAFFPLLGCPDEQRGNFCSRNNALEKKNVCPVIHFPQ